LKLFFDDWQKPEQRLKGTTLLLRRLAGIAELAKAARGTLPAT